MHTYAHEHTCACMTLSTRGNTDTETHNLYTNMHKHTHTHVYTRIDVQIQTHMHIYTYTHVRTHTHIHTYTHTHTKCTYEHAQARLERRRGSERARSSCRRRKPCTSLLLNAIKPHFAPPIQGLHCTHFLKHQYPSTPPSPLPNIPQNSSRTAGKRSFTVLHWSDEQSAYLWRNSTQFHNDPLRSCRKIGGKTAVQQIRSTRARRNPSQRMTKVTVHEKQRVNEEQPNPAVAHHAITTALRPDNTCSSTLVRSQSTKFMDHPSCEPRVDVPK